MTANRAIAPDFQDDRPPEQVFPDLRAPGLLARWPIIGAVMFIFGVLVFAGVTYELFTHGPLIAWDQLLANTWPVMDAKSPPLIRDIMDAGFYLGYQVVIVLAIPVCLYLIYRRFWAALAMVVAGLLGESALFLSLSNLINRPRPPTQTGVIVHVPGFPSGHALTVVVFYGLLAYLLVPKMPTTFWKVVVAAVALLVIGFVGFSRIFTGGHYLTDILSGYALGIAWFGLAYTLIEIYFEKRRSHNRSTA